MMLDACISSQYRCPLNPTSSHSLNSQQLLSDLKDLASDSLNGRRVGTLGSQHAQDFIVLPFNTIGLDTFGPDNRQHFRFGYNDHGINLVGWYKGK